jgi:hypothetical protein
MIVSKCRELGNRTRMADTGVEEDSGARFAVERSSGVLNFFYTACWLRVSFIHSVHDASRFTKPNVPRSVITSINARHSFLHFFIPR